MATLRYGGKGREFLLCLMLLLAVVVHFLGPPIAPAQTVADAQVSGVRDFVQYWSASLILLNGGNPYSPEQLLHLQQSVGWPWTAPLIMWNPPWTFSLTLPFALLSFPAAQFVWLLVHVLIIVICTQRLARLYGDALGSCRIEWVVALSFVPTMFVIIIGQISPMVLAGLTAFLVLESKGKLLLAGAALAAVSIKPHLLYLLWLALCLWLCREGHWRIVLGASMAFLLAALLPLYFDRSVYEQYLELYTLKGILQPFEQATPTLRNIFPLLLGRSDRWLQALPTAVGIAWLFYYWQKHKLHWRWPEELPLVLLVSVTTSFFAWTYDHVVLLPALIEVTAWLRRTRLPWYRSWAVLGYLAVNGIHAVMRFWLAEEFGYSWLAPALLLCYIVYRIEKQQTARSPQPASI